MAKNQSAEPWHWSSSPWRLCERTTCLTRRPDVLRRIGIASSSMNSMSKVWSQTTLSLATKLRIYQTCIVPILLYGSETWMLLKADSDRLQAFHMRAQRRILGVRWQDMVKSATITERTGLPPISAAVNKRHVALFGHVARLAVDVPTNRALRFSMELRCGHPPSPPGNDHLVDHTIRG